MVPHNTFLRMLKIPTLTLQYTETSRRKYLTPHWCKHHGSGEHKSKGHSNLCTDKSYLYQEALLRSARARSRTLVQDKEYDAHAEPTTTNRMSRLQDRVPTHNQLRTGIEQQCRAFQKPHTTTSSGNWMHRRNHVVRNATIRSCSELRDV